MSYKINTLVIGLILISLTSLSFASGPNKENRGQRMAQELNLTAEQQTQVQEIMKEQKSAAETWRSSHHEQTREKLSQVLNQEQLAKFDAKKKQHKEKRMMRKKNRSCR